MSQARENPSWVATLQWSPFADDFSRQNAWKEMLNLCETYQVRFTVLKPNEQIEFRDASPNFLYNITSLLNKFKGKGYLDSKTLVQNV